MWNARESPRRRANGTFQERVWLQRHAKSGFRKHRASERPVPATSRAPSYGTGLEFRDPAVFPSLGDQVTPLPQAFIKP